MTKSRARPTTDASPRPVRLGRYRYSKWRWRVLVRALDWLGAIVMGVWRRVRPIRSVDNPRRILLVQLDHLGDAVLTSPLLALLRSAYPMAVIEVLASASNHEVFESDPNVDRVRIARKTWFERDRGRFALLSAVLSLGWSLRGGRFDIGIDVRGDILTVFVLALAGIPRRVGWAMGGGGFLLTDIAEWQPGRHEVRSRLALAEQLIPRAEGPLRVTVHVNDIDRIEVGRRLAEAWPDQFAKPLIEPSTRSESGRRSPTLSLALAPRLQAPMPRWDEPDWLHAGRFGASPPLLAVHVGAGTTAKRWPPSHWRMLISRFLADGWRVVVVGGPVDFEAAAQLAPHENLCDWTGTLSVTQTAALLERAELFIGADSGPSHLAASAGVPSVILFSGTNQAAQWRPWSRRSLVLRRRVPCGPCHHKVCPLADHPCMSGLTPERVYHAARRWWARLHPQDSPHAPL